MSEGLRGLRKNINKSGKAPCRARWSCFLLYSGLGGLPLNKVTFVQRPEGNKVKVIRWISGEREIWAEGAAMR